MYTLRTYQRKAVDAAKECFYAKKKKDRNGILVLPTGSGKSIIIATIAKELGIKAVILQPSKEILEQNLEKMQAISNCNTAVYSASMSQRDIGDVTFATIGSVNGKSDLFKEFQVIVIDEAHKVDPKPKTVDTKKVLKMYAQFIAELDVPVLGLTATPYRFRSRRHYETNAPIAESWFITRTRPNIFKGIIHITQVGELFEAGYLCPLEYDCENDYNSKNITMTSSGMGYDPQSLFRYNQSFSIVQKIVDKILTTNRKNYLVYTRSVQESQEVIRLLGYEGIKCEEVSHKTKAKDRSRIIRDFKAGRLNHVVNVRALAIGFDYPGLDCAILGAPGQSVTEYLQKAGRLIRIDEGKISGLLIDLCDNVKKFGKIETFEIVDVNEGIPGKRVKWRLKSNVGYLTGFDMVAGKDLENPKIEEYPVELDADGDEMVPFGKHKGKKLCKASNEYLEFCATKIPNPKVTAVCKKELKRREKL